MQRATLVIRMLLPRLRAVLFILLFLSALAVGPRMLNIDGDLPRHLLMGKLVLDTGRPPATEVFSYVYENRPYTPQEWLAGVIYYSVYAVLGLNGVVLLSAILWVVIADMVRVSLRVVRGQPVPPNSEAPHVDIGSVKVGAEAA